MKGNFVRSKASTPRRKKPLYNNTTYDPETTDDHDDHDWRGNFSDARQKVGTPWKNFKVKGKVDFHRKCVLPIFQPDVKGEILQMQGQYTEQLYHFSQTSFCDTLTIFSA